MKTQKTPKSTISFATSNYDIGTHPDMIYAITKTSGQKSMEQKKDTTAKERFLMAKKSSCYS